jgi:hypothetical protein
MMPLQISPTTLFRQLGLADDPRAVQQFFQMHCPLEASMRIEEAHFWSPAQAGLLRAALSDDAEWAVAVDQLSLALRSAPSQRRT